MLRDRLKSGLLMGLAMLAAVFWLPQAAVPIVLLPLCALAMGEFYSLLDARKIPSFRLIGTIGGVALLAATWYGHGTQWPLVAEADSVVLYLTMAAVFFQQLRYRDSTQPWETMAGSLLGVLYVPFLFNYLAKIILLGPTEGRLLVLYLILVVKFTDIGAYFVGCSIGRHKFCPRISPAKTWEGVIGGVLTGTLVSLVFQQVCHGALGSYQFRRADALIMGVILAIAGVIGDLIESVFKRASGVKDSAGYIRGMGGLLDVLDSLLFTAPLLYILVHFLMERTA